MIQKQILKSVVLIVASVLAQLTLWNHDTYAYSLTVVGGLGYGEATGTSGFGYTFPLHSMAYGGGAIIGFRMFPGFEAQMGFLYMPRGFDENASSLAVPQEFTFNTVQIPFTVHYYFMPSMALGVGGYISHGIGAISSYPMGSPGSAVLTSYGPGSFSADDMGVVVSLSMKFSLLPFFSLIVDGRYLYGLQNISQQSGLSANLTDIQFLGGVRLGK